MSVRSNSLLHPNPAHSCFLEAPDLTGCGPCCEPVCEPQCCPPKARARDAIHMRPREITRSFTLSELGCGASRMPMVVSKVSMTLRRRGACREITCIAPSSSSLDGSVSFAWPDVFLQSSPGQFEGDIFVNGCEMGTVLLVKPDQAAIITTDGVTEENFGCAGCGECVTSCRCGPACAEYPDLIEDPVEAEEPNCGSCASC